jgi:potassium-transporting ATPase ATP-binding subunit
MFISLIATIEQQRIKFPQQLIGLGVKNLQNPGDAGSLGADLMKVTARRDDPSAVLPSRAIVSAAFRDSLAKISPRVQLRNPVTFGVYVGSIFATVMGLATVFFATDGTRRAALVLAIAAWLWLSVVLGNFAEAVAEEWVKARAAALRSKGRPVRAKRLLGANRSEYRLVEVATLRRGDVVLVEANDIIPADGTVIEGAASVSEGEVTGESAPVLRAVGRDLSSVRRGTRVLSDWLVVRVRSREGFFDPMVTISEVTRRPRTVQEIALPMLLATATIALLLGIVPLSHSTGADSGGVLALSALVGLLVWAIPITTRASVFAIGIFSMARLIRANVIASSGGAVEAAADIDMLVLDKTGTITRGDRHAVAFQAAPGIALRDLLDVAQLASLADETPEGRSIVELVTQMPDQHPRDLSDTASTFHEFSAQTRISGVDLEGRRLRKGAADAVRRFAEEAGGSWPTAVSELVDGVARSGATPLVVADGPRVLGVIELRDIVKGGIREHCAELRRMGIKTIMVTGDNRLTATVIATEVGVDDFLAEATPERKRELIRRCQKEGYRVAMCGDGTNDAPALAQADVAVTMNSGTQAAKEAGSLIFLDSNPTKFIAIVETGKQMLMTRRSLTTFSMAADLAKYFAILPVTLAAIYPALNALNVTRLTSRRSAILSAVIFSALIIAPLLLLAVRGVKARARSAARLSRRTPWIYGLGGFLLPWVGIKLIDVCLTAFRFV